MIVNAPHCTSPLLLWQLKDPATGKIVKLSDFQGAKALLVTFICVHCECKHVVHNYVSKLCEFHSAASHATVLLSAPPSQLHKGGTDSSNDGLASDLLAAGVVCTPQAPMSST